MHTSAINASRQSWLWVAAIFLVLFAVHLGLNLGINSGQLTYTLDDAYIHLSLAENIARGHYGINPGESSAPASSVLWPFLLAPLAPWSFGLYFPLVINVLAALATLGVYCLILSSVAIGTGAPSSRVYIIGSCSVLMIGTNLLGLVFSGMEHSLQVLVALLLLYGIILESRTGRLHWWVTVLIVVGPLIRYELLALSVPGLCYLLYRRHHRAALAGIVGMIVLLGGYSLFLLSIGVGPLPSSLSAKSSFISSGGSLSTIFQLLKSNLGNNRGILLASTVPILMLASFRRAVPSGERALVWWGIAAVTLHLLFGRFGWYHRYEIYIWSMAVLLLVYLYRSAIARVFRDLGGVKFMIVAGLFTAVVCKPYVDVLTNCHLAASNIYQQQYQMYRFATEYYRAPVAVNDIGYVSYRNNSFVVDLWGLTSGKTLELRRNASDKTWMTDLALAHGANLAMVYDSWVEPVPDNWIPIAEMYLGHRLVSAGSDKVTFYCLDRASMHSVQQLLHQFRQTLPEGVRIEIRGYRQD